MNILKRKNKKSSLWYLRYLAAFVLAPIVGVLYCELDLTQNPWLVTAANGFNWHWYNYLTSGHGVTILYIQRSPWFMAELFVVAIVMTGMLWRHDTSRR